VGRTGQLIGIHAFGKFLDFVKPWIYGAGYYQTTEGEKAEKIGPSYGKINGCSLSEFQKGPPTFSHFLLWSLQSI